MRKASRPGGGTSSSTGTSRTTSEVAPASPGLEARVTAPGHLDPRIQARFSGNDRLQIEANALVEADAWGWRGGRSGEVGSPGDAIGRFDQSHISFSGDEEECGIGIRHELLRGGVVVHQQLAHGPAFGERAGDD